MYLETIKTFLTEGNGNDHLLFSLLYILKFFRSKTLIFQYKKEKTAFKTRLKEFD